MTHEVYLPLYDRALGRQRSKPILHDMLMLIIDPTPLRPKWTRSCPSIHRFLFVDRSFNTLALHGRGWPGLGFDWCLTRALTTGTSPRHPGSLSGTSKPPMCRDEHPMVIIHVGMGNLEKPSCFPMTGGGEERAASRALHAPVSADSLV